MAKSKAPGIPDVKAKSLSDLYTEAVNADINSLPALSSAYNTYGPQYADAISKQYQQLVPPIIGAFNQANPTLTTAQAFSNQRLQDAMSGEIPSDILVPFRESVRSAQAARGLAESPLSAASEALQLGQFGEEYKQNIFNQNTQLLAANPSTQALTNASPTPMTPEQLGLAPANPSTLVQVGQEQNALDINTQLALNAARQQAYNKQIANQQAILGGVGAGAGAIIGGVATGGNPLGITAGAKAGQSVGAGVGTFF